MSARGLCLDPGKDLEFYIPVVYMTCTFSLVTLTVLYGMDFVSRVARIRFGYCVYVVTMGLVPLIDSGVTAGTISQTASFWLILLSVATTSLGSGCMQPSMYGYGGMLPKRYTQVGA